MGGHFLAGPEQTKAIASSKDKGHTGSFAM